jgi:hypothetical protein
MVKRFIFILLLGFVFLVVTVGSSYAAEPA